jgi:hypothetical protein
MHVDAGMNPALASLSFCPLTLPRSGPRFTQSSDAYNIREVTLYDGDEAVSGDGFIREPSVEIPVRLA